ncbi:SpoIIE family protein phosphatase [Micromonospora sp. NPDC050686]|uniref:ATP-binding SpoIIE family protein phosphatase n=1 Tax=Micromonospora sp. NPDC050686 TaxID=3154631 RepID=UPI0033EFDBC0
MSSALGGEDGGGPSPANGRPASTVLPPLLAATFAASGEMGRRLAEFDRSATRFGHPADWSPALRHAMSLMLGSRAQIVLFWGDEYHAFYNDAYLPTIGSKHPDALGRPAREHWVETWDILEPLLDGVRGTGEPYRGQDHPFVLDRYGFLEDVYFDISYDPVRDDDGSITGVFCFVNETTGRVLGERRLRALAELGSELADVRTDQELAEAVVRVLDGHRADVPFALLYLRDAGGRLTLAGASGVPGRQVAGEPPAIVARVAAGSVEDGRVGVEELLGGEPPDAGAEALVLPLTAINEPAGALVVGPSCRQRLTDEYRDFFDLVGAQISRAVGKQQAYEQERARVAELAALVRELVDMHGGRVIRRLRGLADAAVAVNTAPSTADVVRVAAEHALSLAEAARVTISTATGARHEAEHRIATTLQHSLLPRSLPQLPGAVMASRYLPGSADVEVGGDWYDVIGLDDDELVLVIGDVVGKGVRAAAAMGQLRNTLRAYVLEGFDPGLSLTRLNRLVGSTEGRSFATMVCLHFSPRTGRLRYANAGHPSPLLIRGDHVAFLHDRALGPPVGAIPDAAYRTVEGRLAPGNRLLLYTDGLFEDRRIGLDEALDQLRADASRPGEHVSDLVDAVLERVAGRPRHDDVAVLALEAADLNRFALRLPADPNRLTVLRRRLEDFLLAHRVGEADLFDLTVAVSEAAANAIEHPVAPAEPTIEVEVTIEDRTVVATVRDSGRWRESTGSGFRGRGLALIRALAEVSMARTEHGTEVTLRRELRD